ncbi:hypothetical protein LVB87_13030 [Lysobacter sp. KIS68-7]|uniref:hypothetical protein n=1 Tax=Lysobacter sp. KIS68-7 TaxID=2904252 RepID=UPI001E638E0F|nr:hypothetical protein [Lysobacter sp. KIS68-7]UHQ19098.1 hypothetical protein LVB87_13030 [Lysobacter sp. KIS68-7]
MTREFKSLEEVEALDGYNADNLVVPEQYAGVEGPYHFEFEVKCRLRKNNGRPCGEPHKHGWVLRSKDGGKAMIGGDCALEHFGIRSDELRRDMTLVSNALDVERTRAAIQQRVAEGKGKLGELLIARAELANVKAELVALRDDLGPVAWTVLEGMARADDARVRVTGVINAKREGDEVVRDRQTRPIVLGSLRSVRACLPETIAMPSIALAEVIGAYQRAEAALLLVEKPKEMKAFAAVLARTGSAIGGSRQAVAAVRQFLENDFSFVCFAIEDRGARYKVARAAHHRRGSAQGMEWVKKWVADTEMALRQAHGVDRVEFNDSWRRGLHWSTRRPATRVGR